MGRLLRNDPFFGLDAEFVEDRLVVPAGLFGFGMVARPLGPVDQKLPQLVAIPVGGQARPGHPHGLAGVVVVEQQGGQAGRGFGI